MSTRSPVWLLWLTKFTIPSAAFGGGAMICTPDEPSFASWLRYLTSSGPVKPKNRYTSRSTSPRGERLSRSHSSRHGFIRSRAAAGMLGLLPGQREECGLQVGGERLARDQPGPARGEYLRDAL